MSPAIDPRDHVGLCFRAARRFGRHLGDEALSVAYIALVAAAKGYPSSSAFANGYAFTSHAMFRIRGAFRDHVRGYRGRRALEAARTVTIDPAGLAGLAIDRRRGPVAEAIDREEVGLLRAALDAGPPPGIGVACRECGATRWPGEFPPTRHRACGHQARCRECYQEYNAAWRRARKAKEVAA